MFKKFKPKSNKVTISRDWLDSLSDDEIEFEIFDKILELIGNNFKDEHKIVCGLPSGLTYFYATWLLESEVNNGGFNQFFYNSSVNFIDEARDGLVYFGDIKLKELLDEAVEIFMNEIDMQIKTREIGTIEAFSESYEKSNLDTMDSKFYSMDYILSNLRINHIRNNPGEYIIK